MSVLLIAVIVVGLLYLLFLYSLYVFVSVYATAAVIAASLYYLWPKLYPLFGIGSSNIDPHLLTVVVPGLTRDRLTLALISDTHGKHENIDVDILRQADLLLVSGDITANTKPHQVKRFVEWLNTTEGLPPKERRVVIAGNHDPLDTGKLLADSCVYLENSSCTIDGITIYGSPHTPLFKVHTSFQLKLDEMRSAWKKIPEDVDILMTHGPPFGLLDQTFFGMHVGDKAMSEKLNDPSFRPKMIQFGHIHEGYGACKHNSVLLVNASTCSVLGSAGHDPVLVEVRRQ